VTSVKNTVAKAPEAVFFDIGTMIS